ncbi:MAG: hypothetical protein IT514_14605 [Burkholderiales bacterium]|nr:hypothetical protein [Burkholderiales bacterium]
MSSPRPDFAASITDNPFYVLEVRPGCGRHDFEDAAQKWLAMLELGLAAASHYPTPLGPQPRTSEKVRWAANELRDPQRRAGHELWAELEPIEPAKPAPEPAGESSPGPAAWPEALRVFGWRPA